MPRLRWTDDRIDDLARTVLDNDKLLELVAAKAEKSMNDLDDLHKRDALSSRSRYEQAAIIAALCSPIVTLILSLIHH